MTESWARARCGISCGCQEACPSLEERAERRRDEWEPDPYGWQADREADRYERQLDEPW